MNSSLSVKALRPHLLGYGLWRYHLTEPSRTQPVLTDLSAHAPVSLRKWMRTIFLFHLSANYWLCIILLPVGYLQFTNMCYFLDFMTVHAADIMATIKKRWPCCKELPASSLGLTAPRLPAPDLSFQSGEDAFFLDASDGECLADQEDDTNASPLTSPQPRECKAPTAPLMSEFQ